MPAVFEQRGAGRLPATESAQTDHRREISGAQASLGVPFHEQQTGQLAEQLVSENRKALQPAAPGGTGTGAAGPLRAPPPPPRRKQERPAASAKEDPPERTVPTRAHDQRQATIKDEVRPVDQAAKAAYLHAQSPNWKAIYIRLERRLGVYDTGNSQHHAIWVIDSKDCLALRGIRKDSTTYKYLTSREGSPEHAVLVETEKLLMRSFAEAKRLFPAGIETYRGCYIATQGNNTGMTTGNVLGVGVNSSDTDRLLELVADGSKTGDYTRVKGELNWLTSAFAHENMHRVRGRLDDNPRLSANEVPASAIQFMATWDKEQPFFASRMAFWRGSADPAVTRLHAELGGLRLVQDLLQKNKECLYRPADFSPAELRKAIESIPASRRDAVLQSMVKEISAMPVQDFERMVKEVFTARANG